jgi:hypothetical protein
LRRIGAREKEIDTTLQNKQADLRVVSEIGDEEQIASLTQEIQELNKTKEKYIKVEKKLKALRFEQRKTGEIDKETGEEILDDLAHTSKKDIEESLEIARKNESRDKKELRARKYLSEEEWEARQKRHEAYNTDAVNIEALKLDNKSL